MVRAFRHVAERMMLPRTVITRHPMGRPVGAAGDAERQASVIQAAMDALDRAVEGGTIVELEPPFQPGSLD